MVMFRVIAFGVGDGLNRHEVSFDVDVHLDKDIEEGLQIEKVMSVVTKEAQIKTGCDSVTIDELIRLGEPTIH